jgi:hypothetical protein
MEERPCAHCKEGFRLNPRARATHHFCSKLDCQRERRRLNQRARRTSAVDDEPSRAGRAERAAYMRAYRAAHEGYRQREQEGARRRRNEAGSTPLPARVYLLPGRGPELRVRVVSDAGLAVTVRGDATSRLGLARRNEAG